jgi:hypothetical protein
MENKITGITSFSSVYKTSLQNVETNSKKHSRNPRVYLPSKALLNPNPPTNEEKQESKRQIKKAGRRGRKRAAGLPFLVVLESSLGIVVSCSSRPSRSVRLSFKTPLTHPKLITEKKRIRRNGHSVPP